jgi:hypothetical protein
MKASTADYGKNPVFCKQDPTICYALIFKNYICFLYLFRMNFVQWF